MISRIIASIIGGVGHLALLLAFFLLYRDLSKALGGAALHITTLGDLWSAVHPTSLQSLQPVIERHVAEWPWAPVFLSALTTQAFGVLAVTGVIVMTLGRLMK
jgi:hypothetical protein